MGKHRLIFTVLTYAFSFLTLQITVAQKTDKIQHAIDAIKAANNNETDDYITDGQRTVWVKSYKKWKPDDFGIMKKEDPATLRFLKMAAQRARYDVLEKLLPNYYRTHGGVKAFASDITRAAQ